MFLSRTKCDGTIGRACDLSPCTNWFTKGTTYTLVHLPHKRPVAVDVAINSARVEVLAYDQFEDFLVLTCRDFLKGQEGDL